MIADPRRWAAVRDRTVAGAKEGMAFGAAYCLYALVLFAVRGPDVFSAQGVPSTGGFGPLPCRWRDCRDDLRKSETTHRVPIRTHFRRNHCRSTFRLLARPDCSPSRRHSSKPRSSLAHCCHALGSHGRCDVLVHARLTITPSDARASPPRSPGPTPDIWPLMATTPALGRACFIYMGWVRPPATK
jgi:hypothetical protein